MMPQSSIALQLLDATHLDVLTALANDPQISVTSSVPHPCTTDEVQGWIDDNNASPPPKLTYVVLYKGEVAGTCSLKHINYEERHAELSYWIGRPYWGLGSAGHAATLLRDRALESGQFEHLIARCLKLNNPYSQRIILKLGFLPDESVEDRSVMGRWGDAFPGDVWQHYILTHERWLGLKLISAEGISGSAELQTPTNSGPFSDTSG